jgi:D-amino peptidase
MKVLVYSDMEGVSGIHTYRQVIKEFGELFDEGRELLTRDVNAAIEGLRDAGASGFVVADSHRRGSPPNVLDGMLPEGTAVIRGDEISGYDYSSLQAQVLVGFHSMAGTEDGFLSHTMSSLLGFALRVNGKWAGEGELEVWKAGMFEVPTILAGGDSALTSEIRGFFPDIATVTVKTSRGRTKVHCRDAEEARDEIRRSARDALSRLPSFKIHSLEGPLELVLAFKSAHLADWALKMPNTQRVHERAVLYMAGSWEEARAAYHTAYHLAFRLVDPATATLEANEHVSKLREDSVRRSVRERWARPLEPLPDIPWPCET